MGKMSKLEGWVILVSLCFASCVVCVVSQAPRGGRAPTATTPAPTAEEIAAIKARNEQRAKRFKSALKEMTEKYDDIQGLTWYRHRGASKFVNSRTDVFLYFAVADDGRISAPHLNLQYVADEWLFISKIIIKADSSRYTITAPYGGVERDHGSGKIWEWLDYTVADSEMQMLRNIAHGAEVKVRFVGRAYSKDRQLSAEQLHRLSTTLDAYVGFEAGLGKAR